RTVFGLGGAQVLGIIAITCGACAVAGVSWQGGIALGGILAMSSTAIVSQMLAERAELQTRHGRQIVGVLLFQDLAVVPLLIVLPALATGNGNLGGALAVAALKASILLAILLFFGQRVMRAW